MTDSRANEADVLWSLVTRLEELDRKLRPLTSELSELTSLLRAYGIPIRQRSNMIQQRSGGIHSDPLRRAVHRLNDFTCVYCGSADSRLEIDHIEPRSRGGQNWGWNLTSACKSCNVRKGNQPVDVFLKKRAANG